MTRNRGSRTVLCFSACSILAIAGSWAGLGAKPSPASSAEAQQFGSPVSAKGTNAVSIEKRVQEYWDRRKAKDLAGAYPFYCSPYRSRVSQAQFLQLTRLVRFDLLEVRVASVVPMADRAEVTIAYRFMVPTLPEPERDGRTTEIWARDTNEQWCKEDEPLVLPFPSTTPPVR